MGEVYRARDARLDRDVAIKVLPAHLSNSPEASARFDAKPRRWQRSLTLIWSLFSTWAPTTASISRSWNC